MKFACTDKKHYAINMSGNDLFGRQAMMNHSTTANMPVTWREDILPTVLSYLGAHPDTQGNKTSSNFLKTLYNINKRGAVRLFEITADRYKRNLEVIFKSDLIIHTCKSINERPLGACVNLFFVEDVKQTASVLKKVSYVAPRVPRAKRMGTKTARPLEHNIERIFEPYSFDSDVDIPVSIYDGLVNSLFQLVKHAQDQINVQSKHTYVKRMRDVLNDDVNSLLENSQHQMRMGVVHVHLMHIATNSASADMLSTLNEVGTGGEECCLSTILDILVQKQLEQWLVPEKGQASAIKKLIQVFDEHTSTPTGDSGLQVKDEYDNDMELGGVVIVSGATSLNIPTIQMQATYTRSVRTFELKTEDYDPDRLMVTHNIAKKAFPKYTMDERLIVKEHNRDNGTVNGGEREDATTMNIQGKVTVLQNARPNGVFLLDNVGPVYIVDQDREMDPLTSVLRHTTQSMWNMMNGYGSMGNTSGDFAKSDHMSHTYVDTSTPDLYIDPTGKARQKINASMIKNAVFNDPYIYSPYFAQCFNVMYKAAMLLKPTSKTHIFFDKCMKTAHKVYQDAHAWHDRYRRSNGSFTCAGNGEMIMSELHPYFDALPTGEGLQAYNRYVHGNIPLYIRPTPCMLVAGQTLARRIWGHKSYNDFTADKKSAESLAKDIDAFFTGMVSTTAHQASTHMLYSQDAIDMTDVSGLQPDQAAMCDAKPMSLILGLCGLPFLMSGSLTKGFMYKWTDKSTKMTVFLDAPILDQAIYSEEAAGTRFFYKLPNDDREGKEVFSHLVRPAFHELMKEIKASAECFAVKMCAMFCAWIRLTPEGTEFAFNHTRWPLSATVLTFKEDSTKHVLVSRPNSIISLADTPSTDMNRQDDKVTIASTAHHRITCDGINTNSVIGLHAMGSSRTQTFGMTVSTPPTKMKDNIKVDISSTDAFTGYKNLLDWSMAASTRKRTHMGKTVISLAGQQLAWVCPPVTPTSAFQRPTNPTGRSSVSHSYVNETSFVNASVDMHDPTIDHGRCVSTLNPYATLPGGYVFCLHADPNGKVGEVNNCTYRKNHGASPAAHFFSPPQILTGDKNRGASGLAKKLCNLTSSRRVLGDHDKFPIFIDGDSCHSSFMNQWSETTGMAQHEPHASNGFIYDNMISSRQSDCTFASREVVWCNHHYAVPGHTFYAKNKSYAHNIVSPS